MRILPEICARTRWPFSSDTRNIAFGSASATVPLTSIASPLDIVIQLAQNLRAGGSNRDGMFEMGRQLAIGGNRGPSIAENFQFRHSLVNHRLDSQHHSFLQPRIGHSRPKVIRHLWLFVELTPDSMAGELGHYRVASALGGMLNRASDVADAVADARLFNSGVKRIACNLHQAARAHRDVPNRYGTRGVAEITLITNPEVEPDDITLLQPALC